MSTSLKTNTTKKLEDRKILVEREFAAPVDKVWKAWTQKECLDQWWAPKPWKAVTKEMKFTEGGHWLYSMVGPDGTASFCKVEFREITPLKSFEAVDYFCDEDGNQNIEFPAMTWKTAFMSTGTATKVFVEITFANEEDGKKIIEMGFEDGFAAAHKNLDEWLANN